MHQRLILPAVVFAVHLPLMASFTPGEARRMYGESSSAIEGSSGFREVGEYIFAKIEWEDDGATDEDRDANELSAILEALQKYVSPPRIACTNSPFCKALTTWMVPGFEFKIPKVASSVVRSEDGNGRCLRVIAFDAPPLKAAKAETLKNARKLAERANNRTEAEWVKRLKEARAHFKTAEERRKFNVMLGCPIVDFIECKGKFAFAPANEDEKQGNAELAQLLEWRPDAESVFAKHPRLFWRTHREGGSSMFFPDWREDDGGKFAEAERLYLKGKDVPRIVELLAESIALNPIGEKKWAYLGGALKALNRPADALIAYMQALRFNGGNPWAWKGVKDCCEKLGWKSNAAGLGWYFKLNGIK